MPCLAWIQSLLHPPVRSLEFWAPLHVWPL